jgi:peroxiredoxin 2/4
MAEQWPKLRLAGINLRWETAMSIQVAKPAPAFDVTAYVRGEPAPLRISLRQCRGQWVVLFFYPRDFSFVCPTELQAFARLQGEFTREGALVLAASTDSYHSHKAWFESDARLGGVAYPVIADTSQRLAKAFGVLVEEGMALRATFIIDPDGVVRHSLVNDLDVGRNADETLRTLRALRAGALCPAGWQPGQPPLGGTLSTIDALAA